MLTSFLQQALLHKFNNGFMKNWIFIIGLVSLLVSCHKEEKGNHLEKTTDDTAHTTARIQGVNIVFPENSPQLGIFKTVRASDVTNKVDFSAPASVIARCTGIADMGRPFIIFQDPDLISIYSTYIQNLSILSLTKTNYDRIKDLYDNGAATGKEVNEATASLFSVRNAIIESEGRLEEQGIDPKSLLKAKKGKIWIISDLPETELDMVKTKSNCQLFFPSFPTQHFLGYIEDIDQVLNIETRKIRVRISMQDNQMRFRPGMYAKAVYAVTHKGIMMPRAAIISVNASYYVFVKKSPNVFECREVVVSTESNGFLEISEGLKDHEEVVVGNTYLLKGLYFGI